MYISIALAPMERVHVRLVHAPVEMRWAAPDQDRSVDLAKDTELLGLFGDGVLFEEQSVSDPHNSLGRQSAKGTRCQ